MYDNLYFISMVFGFQNRKEEQDTLTSSPNTPNLIADLVQSYCFPS